MHLYWRVIEELKYLNETWTIHDPTMARWFRKWLEKNADAIALTVDVPYRRSSSRFSYKGTPYPLS